MSALPVDVKWRNIWDAFAKYALNDEVNALIVTCSFDDEALNALTLHSTVEARELPRKRCVSSTCTYRYMRTMCLGRQSGEARFEPRETSGSQLIEELVLVNPRHGLFVLADV
jgi:hypothetical protein